jgi:hypothetical protein
MKRALLISAAALHLSLIVISMTKPKVDPHNSFWHALSWYGKLTGASATYSFFSPDIPRELVFHFTIYNPDQTSFETTIQQTANNEVDARLGNILRMIPKSYEHREIVRSMAASLSASMFRSYPDAAKVGIRTELFLLPSMADFRNGNRASLMPVYSAVFAKDSGT